MKTSTIKLIEATLDLVYAAALLAYVIVVCISLS